MKARGPTVGKTFMIIDVDQQSIGAREATGRDGASIKSATLKSV